MVEEIYVTRPRLVRTKVVEVVKCCVCRKNLLIDGLGTYGNDVYRVQLTVGGPSMGTDYVCSLACLKKYAEISMRKRKTNFGTKEKLSIQSQEE
jgi:hypothetical protein